MPYSNETRVRCATDEEAISRTRRSGSCGNWLVERFWVLTGSKNNSGYFNLISSHLSEEAALRAQKRLDKKIAGSVK